MADGEEGMVVPWRRLEGKVVMVTGASSGIGYDLCVDLAGAGCRIVAAARRTDRLESLCEKINGSPAAVRSAVAVELDVSADSAAVEESVRNAWVAFGRIDALINNAGIRGPVLSMLDFSEEEWNKILATNATGVWLVSKHVCKRMREAKLNGSVINISSVAGLPRGLASGGLAYRASKTAALSITKVMALELGEYNIRVNAICPGLFKSEITQGLLEKEWFYRVTRRIYPLGQIGTTDPALTSLVRYLVHESSEYVTGNDFIVDCGVSLPGVPIFSSL